MESLNISRSCMSLSYYMHTSCTPQCTRATEKHCGGYQLETKCALIRLLAPYSARHNATAELSMIPTSDCVWTQARQQKTLLPTLRSLKAKQNRWTCYASVSCCCSRTAHTNAVHPASHVLISVKSNAMIMCCCSHVHNVVVARKDVSMFLA